MENTLKLKLYDGSTDSTKNLSVANANPSVNISQINDFVTYYNELYDSDYDLISAVVSSSSDSTIFPAA